MEDHAGPGALVDGALVGRAPVDDILDRVENEADAAVFLLC